MIQNERIFVVSTPHNNLINEKIEKHKNIIKNKSRVVCTLQICTLTVLTPYKDTYYMTDKVCQL